MEPGSDQLHPHCRLHDHDAVGPRVDPAVGISDAQFGLLVSAYSLAAGASGISASTVIDWLSARPLLFLYAGFTLATWGAAWRLGMSLMCARVAAGVFGGVLGALVQTIVGDAIPFERRGRAMGVVMSAFSLSTVAGVPLSLWLATQGGWHLALPGYRGRIVGDRLGRGAIGARAVAASGPICQAVIWVGMRQVFSEANHWRAFALSCLMMAGSFQHHSLHHHLHHHQRRVACRSSPAHLPGGGGYAVHRPPVGWMSDRWGKVATFRLVSALAVVPMMALTLLPPVPLWMVLVVTTAFFVFVSGRMVPGMALLTAAPQASMRGAFMSANGALQSVTMGVSAWLVAA